MENLVITPHKRISACCGLTFEHIPEMILGNTSSGNYQELFSRQLDDLLKLWIKTHGPLFILKKVYGEEPEMTSVLNNIQHQCHACVILHEKDRVNHKLREHLSSPETVMQILNKINIRSVVDNIRLKATS